MQTRSITRDNPITIEHREAIVEHREALEHAQSNRKRHTRPVQHAMQTRSTTRECHIDLEIHDILVFNTIKTEETQMHVMADDTSSDTDVYADTDTTTIHIDLSTLEGRSEYNRVYYKKRKSQGGWKKKPGEQRRPYNRSYFPKREPGFTPMFIQESKEDRHARINAQRMQGIRVNHIETTAVRNAATREYRCLNPDIAVKFDKDNAERVKQYQRNRFATDPVYKISCLVRNRLYKCLKGRGFKKTTHTEKLLGCTWEHVADHLDNNAIGLKLTDESVHVDHIRPIASFKDLSCEFEQRTVNHYLNLQLLSARDNLSKHAKFDYGEWEKSDSGMALLKLNRQWRMDEYFGIQ